jgi:PadR family transcriptional regulator, regulatory protein PadR
VVVAFSIVYWHIALVDHRHKLMRRRESPLQFEMVQGTLYMLILRTLVLSPAHGQMIAHAIERGSEEVLRVEHGSLYPALHRLDNRGWIASFWGTSENNRKAKYYRLTTEGRKQLASQTSRWQQVVQAIGRNLNPATGGYLRWPFGCPGFRKASPGNLGALPRPRLANGFTR